MNWFMKYGKKKPSEKAKAAKQKEDVNDPKNQHIIDIENHQKESNQDSTSIVNISHKLY